MVNKSYKTKCWSEDPQTKDDIEALLYNITNHIHNVVAIPMWNSVNLVHFGVSFHEFICKEIDLKKITRVWPP